MPFRDRTTAKFGVVFISYPDNRYDAIWHFDVVEKH